MSSIYINGIEMPQDETQELCIVIRHDGTVYHSLDLNCKKIANAIPVSYHKGPLVDVLEVLNTFPDDFIFTNEQVRALTNYIIPANKEDLSNAE